MLPYELTMFSDLKVPFEGKANIRSDYSVKTKLQIDPRFETRLNANALPVRQAHFHGVPLPETRSAHGQGDLR
jgi:hypothetical protein